MKRFYKLVSTEKQNNNEYGIFLDGKPVLTRARKTLLAPNETVAYAVVKEWQAQGEDILPDTMPITQILNTRIDRVANAREAMTAAVIKYLDTDLVCYSCEMPEELGAIQEKTWKPFRDSFAQIFGQELQTTKSLFALKQDEKLASKVKDYVSKLDDDRFTILQIITSASGSIVIAMALMENKTGVEEMMKACFVEEDYRDEIYNAEKHGEDPIIEKTRIKTRAEFQAAKNFLDML